jgi:Protein of unknown function (DUF1552)
MNSKTIINRRKFLRGLGGAAVAAPFLASVAEQEAKAAGTTASDPKRLIVFFTHYGCLTDRWFPKLSHGALSSSDYMAMDTLKPMAPYAQKLLMVRGVRAMNEWSFGGTLGQTTDPHTQPCGSFFTCQPVTPDNGKFTATPTDRSLDHVVAEQINPSGGGPLFIQIGGNFSSTQNTQAAISFDKPNNLFPGVSSPMQIYSSLTNLFGKGTTSSDTWANASGNSIIDIISDDLATLQKVNMSGSDKQKLSDWKDLLHQTSGTMSAMCTQSVADGIVTASAVKTASSGGGLSVDISKITDVMYDLALLTAICDSNRVIFMKMPPNYVFSFLSYNGSPFTVESHSISHRIGNANMGGTCISGVMDMIHIIDQWYAQQFANLVGKLDGFMEGTGTVLDNSATVWFQEMSDGDSHNLNNLPILQAGSCGGYFKVGQAVDVENTSGKGSDTGGTPNTALSVGNSDGDCVNGSTLSNLDSAGTPAATATQPINKYFCNLMNAVGVKADSTGFPVKGGTMPVTHYGKYDDSTLFKGGGTAAASIKDPGEFKILKAGT